MKQLLKTLYDIMAYIIVGIKIAFTRWRDEIEYRKNAKPCCICKGKYFGIDDGKPYCYDHWTERTGLPF